MRHERLAGADHSLAILLLDAPVASSLADLPPPSAPFDTLITMLV